ncbi:MAG: hypothetical protein ACREE6_09575, partial [Limisphaerales bacterium]
SDAPHIVHPFNYGYCFENLLKAELLVGRVDRDMLTTNPVTTLKAILSLQQALIVKKSACLQKNGNAAQKKAAATAATLIKKSQAVSSINPSDTVLLPSEYTVRAEMMTEARRLVGGVEIEVTEEMKK